MCDRTQCLKRQFAQDFCKFNNKVRFLCVRVSEILTCEQAFFLSQVMFFEEGKIWFSIWFVEVEKHITSYFLSFSSFR